MTEGTALVLGQIQKAHPNCKIVDATEMFHDMLIYYGVPTQEVQNRRIDLPKYYDMCRENIPEDLPIRNREVFYRTIAMDEAFVRDHRRALAFPLMISTLVPDLEKAIRKEFPKVTNQEDIHRAATSRAYTHIMNYVSALRAMLDAKIFEDLSAYCSAVDIEFMPFGDPYKHISEASIKKIKDARDAIPWHMPFDRCIVLMGENAVVYLRDEDDPLRASLYIYGMCGGFKTTAELRKVSHYRLVLNEKGDFIETVKGDDPNDIEADDAHKVGVGTMDDRTHTVGLSMLTWLSSNDYIALLANIGVIHKDLVDWNYPYETPIQMTHLLKMAESARKLYAETLSIDALTPRGKVKYMRAVAGISTQLFLPVILDTLTITILFMTCRQVRLREHTEMVRAYRPNGNKKKGGAKSAYHKVTYNTVSIHMEDQLREDLMESVRSETPVQGGSGKRIRHVRRGNFAVYTAEKPLFGKYTGIIWRPATIVNGSGDVDETRITDYKVSVEPPGKK